VGLGESDQSPCPRCVLQGAQMGSLELLFNFSLIIKAFCYLHKEYQIILKIQQYKNVYTDTHISMYLYIFPGLLPNAKTKTKEKIYS
jgi:hypothetical protein